jgi:hypothetical protein
LGLNAYEEQLFKKDLYFEMRKMSNMHLTSVEMVTL